MTFDDGIIGVYELTEVKTPGKMPTEGLSLKERFFFRHDILGINRYYIAKQAGQNIEDVISIPGWNTFTANRHIVIFADADGNIDSSCPQYRIVMVQPTHDEQGLRITRLTLEKVGEEYAVWS